MKTSGFWTGGPNEHRRSIEQQLTILRKRLENCEPDDRQRIAEEIDQAVEELKKPDDDQILW